MAACGSMIYGPTTGGMGFAIGARLPDMRKRAVAFPLLFIRASKKTFTLTLASLVDPFVYATPVF